MLSAFSSLPRPIQFVSLLGVGTGAASVGLAAAGPHSWRIFFTIVAAGIIGVAVLVALYVLFMKMRDKSKSGPFAQLIAKAGGGRSTVDPAQKARMDDLRKKFDEGVSTFKSAGKDLYSLPWYLLVGPSGSGKTEAMRHCNVGFPPGLQDCLQGTGGTMNMHWWFTNQAVVLDTAGRMFMEEGADSQSTEWKEFMKLLKDTRPNAPINGMLLVISAESLLKDSADKIEKTAAAIARQLDVVQRTLDVRFPVFVIVTKCDKIVGFREFFETINDPVLQHQLLGWSNPASLDEVFKPKEVGAHLDTVRERLHKRRMGLLQNPIHTTDPTARRTDQVDEMFELPDNLVRIAPRLTRYLEMIFVTGEWSPKPLFLRGIYFTSSMREGQALDVALAQALGTDVDSIPGGKEWDKDKAYFLRDVFLDKVFKERGLVTRADNVGRTLARQRRNVIIASTVAVAVFAIVGVFGWMSFSDSIGPPSAFWHDVNELYGSSDSQKKMSIVKGDKGAWTYRGGDRWDAKDRPSNDLLGTPGDVVIASGSQTHNPLHVPGIALPLTGLLPSQDEQVAAHRAVVERAVVGPLVNAARVKISSEQTWTPTAVAALSQLIRLETYSLGSTPAGIDPKAKGTPPSFDAEAMFNYVLTDTNTSNQHGYSDQKVALIKAVTEAYPQGWGKPADMLGGADTASSNINLGAVNALAKDLTSLRGKPIKELKDLFDSLSAMRMEEDNLKEKKWFQPGPTGGPPQTLGEYDTFETDFLAATKRIADDRDKADGALAALGLDAGDVGKLFEKASATYKEEMADGFKKLKDELPSFEGKAGKDAKPELVALSARIDEKAAEASQQVDEKLRTYAAMTKDLAPLMAMGHADKDVRSYAARADAYQLAAKEVQAANPKAADAKPAGDAPAPEAAASLVARIDEIDKATDQSTAVLTTIKNWVSAPGTRADPAASPRASADIAQHAVEIARGRRMHELASATISKWPVESAGIASRVAERQRAHGATGEFADVPRPAITLSTMEKESKARGSTPAQPNFKAEYHPAAAREVLADWSRVRDLVEPVSSGTARQVVDRETLKHLPGYTTFTTATKAYVEEYLTYWVAQANDASRPAAESWAEFQEMRKTTTAGIINSDLTELENVVKKAVPAVGDAPTWKDSLTKANSEVNSAFARLHNDEFIKLIEKTYAKWSELARSPADAARATLMESYRAGRIKDEYFAAFVPKGQGTSYWNGFIANGLEVLIRASNADLQRARVNLVEEAKGIPLTFGSPDLKDLTPDALRKIREDIDKLGVATAGDKQPRDADLGDLSQPVVNLAGGNVLTTADHPWFENLRAAVQVFKETPTIVQLGYWGDRATPRAAGMTDDAVNKFAYAALHVGNKYIGDPFALTIELPAQVFEKLRVELPGTANDAVEIHFWHEQPPLQNMPAPDAKASLPGAWSIMRPLLTQPNDTKLDEKTKDWRVLVPVVVKGEAGPSHTYLWVRVHFATTSPVPPPVGMARRRRLAPLVSEA